LELVFFSTDESTNLADVFYLRALNILFIYYGAKQNIKSNFAEGKTGLPENAVSASNFAYWCFY
jgi:hypothetical protein